MTPLVVALSIAGAPAPSLHLAPDLELGPQVAPALLAADAVGGDAFRGGGALGGGGDARVTTVLSLVLGFFPGFGLGHVLAGDEAGFTLWLVVDLALVAAIVVVGEVLLGFGGLGVLRLVAYLTWVGTHLIQALDAYAAAGGPRLLGGRVDPPGAGRLASAHLRPLVAWRF